MDVPSAHAMSLPAPRAEPQAQSPSFPDQALLDEVGGFFLAVFRAFASDVARQSGVRATPGQLRTLQVVVAPFLQADDFYIHRHRWVWEAFNHLPERRTPIDILTLTDELEQMGHLAEIGGPAFLSGLMTNVPTSLHAEAYGRVVEETAVRRRMLDAANLIAKVAYKEDAGIDDVMNEAEKAIFGVSEKRLTRDLQPIQQVLSDYYDRIDQLNRRGEDTFGVPSGFLDLDRLLGGMQPSVAWQGGKAQAVSRNRQFLG